MKFKTVSIERAKEIEENSAGLLQFKIVNSAIKGMQILTQDGPIFIEIDSYSVSVNELATKEVFKLAWQVAIADEVRLIEKEFNSELDRKIYINQYLSNVPETELHLSTEVVQDN